MTKLPAHEIFTPSDFPAHTYVARDGAALETRLRDALRTPGEIVSISGPSKSGKTVLIEKVVGQNDLIPVTGARISKADDLWDRILDWMDTPELVSRDSSKTATTGGIGKITGAIGIRVPQQAA